jgi:hypothetical protein
MNLLLLVKNVLINHQLNRYTNLPNLQSKSGKKFKVDHFEEITGKNSSTDFWSTNQIVLKNFVLLIVRLLLLKSP